MDAGVDAVPMVVEVGVRVGVEVGVGAKHTSCLHLQRQPKYLTLGKQICSAG